MYCFVEWGCVGQSRTAVRSGSSHMCLPPRVQGDTKTWVSNTDSVCSSKSYMHFREVSGDNSVCLLLQWNRGSGITVIPDR